MPVTTPVEANSRRIRIALGLVVAWSLLQCGLLMAIHGIHLSATTAYLLEIIPCIPVFALVALVVRFRKSKPEALPRPYLMGVIIYVAILLQIGLLTVCMEVLFSRGSLAWAALIAALPIVLGIVPAFVLLLPKYALMKGSNLGDILSPVRIKLATPALRRTVRLGVFLVVYLTCRFAIRMAFYRYDPKGILAYALALLPVLPIFGLIPIYNKYMAEEQDEFQRHLFHQSVLWAFLGTLIVACAMGQLHDYALFPRSSEIFPPYMLVLLFYFLQMEAGYVIAAIHAARLKRNQ